MSQFNYFHPTQPKRLSFGYDRPLQQYFYDVHGPDPEDPPEDPEDTTEWVPIESAGLMNGGCSRSDLLRVMVAFGVSPVLLREIALDLPIGHVIGDFYAAYGYLARQGYCRPQSWQEANNPTELTADPLQDQLVVGDMVTLRVGMHARNDICFEAIQCQVLDVHTDDQHRNTPWLTDDTVLTVVHNAKEGANHGYRPGDDVIVHRQQIWGVQR